VTEVRVSDAVVRGCRPRTDKSTGDKLLLFTTSIAATVYLVFYGL
jgi:hypothetical protein